MYKIVALLIYYQKTSSVTGAHAIITDTTTTTTTTATTTTKQQQQQQQKNHQPYTIKSHLRKFSSETHIRSVDKRTTGESLKYVVTTDELGVKNESYCT